MFTNLANWFFDHSQPMSTKEPHGRNPTWAGDTTSHCLIVDSDDRRYRAELHTSVYNWWNCKQQATRNWWFDWGDILLALLEHQQGPLDWWFKWMRDIRKQTDSNHQAEAGPSMLGPKRNRQCFIHYSLRCLKQCWLHRFYVRGHAQKMLIFTGRTHVSHSY